MKYVLLAAFLLLPPMPALAHKVIASVFEMGGVIEGEVGFSSGDMAIGQKVDVLLGDGSVIATVTTDEEGFFSYAPDGPGTYRFRADMGAGHIAMAEITIAGNAPVAIPAPPALSTIAPEGKPSLSKQELSLILRDELRPLRQEITALKEKRELQSILSGIGYILGLFGIGFYVAARAKLRETQD